MSNELLIEYLDKGIGRIKIGDGITPYKNLPYFVDNINKKPIAKICTQCGATLHGNKCRFCDTEFDFI